ncbi:MAG: hypothetical protein MHM6MM_006865 [Cercozoa sp. M6MM]
MRVIVAERETPMEWHGAERHTMSVTLKFHKREESSLTEIEKDVANALLDIEVTVKDLKSLLRPLKIAKVKQVELGAGKKAIVIFVPFVMHQKYRGVQTRLTRALEKKFSGSHVVFVAQRTILPPSHARKGLGLRPRSRTLTAVHEAVLDDIVYPINIVGKRTRIRLDGTKLLKVHLDAAKEADYEAKVATFQAVYKKLTNKNVAFEFVAQIKPKSKGSSE